MLHGIRPDPRLVRHAHATRRFIALSVAIGVAQPVLLVAQAALLADILATAVQRPTGVTDVALSLALLLLATVARAGLAWAAEVVAHRSSAKVKSELRRSLLDHLVRLGPRWLGEKHSGELATLLTRGLDALDDYFARYLPQVVLAALVPLVLTVQLTIADWQTGVLVLGTLPLIPLCIYLSERYGKPRQGRDWETQQRLAHHFLDVLAGLGTLAAFGRSREQVDAVRKMSDIHGRAGLATIRHGLRSNLLLDIVAALSISGVVVLAGLRTMHGGLGLETALLIVLVIPEVYRPVRQVATQLYASEEGLGAAEKVFAILDEEAPRTSTTESTGSTGDEADASGAAGTASKAHTAAPAPDPSSGPIRLDDVTVVGSDRAEPLLYRLSLEIPPGRFTGIVAPSGAGKSTVLLLLLGLIRPDYGRIKVGDIDLADVDVDAWRGRVGWLSQEPVLFEGTVAENIALGQPDLCTTETTRQFLQYAAKAAAVDFDLDRTIGPGGRGLSTGERRRVALARALVGNPGLLLLDEPTESVDPETEAAVFDTLRHGMAGRTVVVVTHRPALLQLCHHVVRLESSAVQEEVPA